MAYQDWQRLSSPAFILTIARSGSTLLRCVLNSHSQIFAPHEFSLKYLALGLGAGSLARSVELHGLDANDLKGILWDRYYDILLKRSGKSLLIDKTHSNLSIWRELLGVWPEAKFVLLKRRQESIISSFVKSFGWDQRRATVNVTRKVEELNRARETLDPRQSFCVDYDDLLRDPVKIIEGLCGFLGVEFEPGMLDYDTSDIRTLDDGVGDWGEKIRSGRIQLGNSFPQ